MPRKIRELIRELLQAGFINRGGKGSHRNFTKTLRMPRRLRRGGMSNLGSGFDARYPDRFLFLSFKAPPLAAGFFTHPKVNKPVVISGQPGDDAQRYQENAVKAAIEDSPKNE